MLVLFYFLLHYKSILAVILQILVLYKKSVFTFSVMLIIVRSVLKAYDSTCNRHNCSFFTHKSHYLYPGSDLLETKHCGESHWERVM